MAALLIWLLVAGLVVFAVFYIINNLIPEPFRKIAIVIAVVIGIIILIMFLQGLGGGSLAFPRLGR